MNNRDELSDVLYYNSRESSIKDFLMSVYSWLRHNLTPSGEQDNCEDQKEQPNYTREEQRMYPRFVVSEGNVCKCCRKLRTNNDQVTLTICNKDF